MLTTVFAVVACLAVSLVLYDFCGGIVYLLRFLYDALFHRLLWKSGGMGQLRLGHLQDGRVDRNRERVVLSVLKGQCRQR